MSSASPGHVGVVGARREVQLHQALQRLEVGERVVAGDAHHVVGAHVRAQSTWRRSTSSSSPRKTGMPSCCATSTSGIVLRVAPRSRGTTLSSRGQRRACARAAPRGAAGRRAAPGPCPGSARRPCAPRRSPPRAARRRTASLQHVLADGLVGLDRPAARRPITRWRLARREARLEAHVGALEGEHVRRQHLAARDERARPRCERAIMRW